MEMVLWRGNKIGVVFSVTCSFVSLSSILLSVAQTVCMGLFPLGRGRSSMECPEGRYWSLPGRESPILWHWPCWFVIVKGTFGDQRLRVGVEVSRPYFNRGLTNRTPLVSMEMLICLYGCRLSITLGIYAIIFNIYVNIYVPDTL